MENPDFSTIFPVRAVGLFFKLLEVLWCDGERGFEEREEEGTSTIIHIAHNCGAKMDVVDFMPSTSLRRDLSFLTTLEPQGK